MDASVLTFYQIYYDEKILPPPPAFEVKHDGDKFACPPPLTTM